MWHFELIFVVVSISIQNARFDIETWKAYYSIEEEKKQNYHRILFFVRIFFFSRCVSVCETCCINSTIVVVVYWISYPCWKFIIIASKWIMSTFFPLSKFSLVQCKYLKANEFFSFFYFQHHLIDPLNRIFTFVLL